MIEDQFNRCRCGKIVKFQAITAKLDEGFCGEECLAKAMAIEESTCLSNTPTSTVPTTQVS